MEEYEVTLKVYEIHLVNGHVLCGKMKSDEPDEDGNYNVVDPLVLRAIDDDNNYVFEAFNFTQELANKIPNTNIVILKRCDDPVMSENYMASIDSVLYGGHKMFLSE